MEENYIKLNTKKRTYIFHLNKCDLEEILNAAGDLILTSCFKNTNEYHTIIYTKDEGIIIDTNITQELFKYLKRLSTLAKRGNLKLP